VRFDDLIRRQLRLFREDYADLIEACTAAERAYDRASREDAEERYGEYLELVQDGIDALAGIRDAYASTLEPAAADEYAAAFAREVKRRLPRFTMTL
jgi:hypothetical protein